MHTCIHGAINHDYQVLHRRHALQIRIRILEYNTSIILQVVEQENWRLEENAPNTENIAPPLKIGRFWGHLKVRSGRLVT